MFAEPVDFQPQPYPAEPTSVRNWEWAEGAILCVLLRRKDVWTVAGSAAMLAPGLAVTATHIFRDDEKDLVAGTTSIHLAGLTSRGLDLWNVRHLTRHDGDVSFLSLVPGSGVRENWQLRTWPVTAKLPRIGSRVYLFGFRMPDNGILESPPGDFAVKGDLYVSSGLVEDFFFPLRDPRFINFPSFQIGCGALGGMSGGPVLNEDGRLIGVVSSSLETEDGTGPSVGAWLIAGSVERLTLPWPEGLYPEKVELWDIPAHMMDFEGRDRVKREGNTIAIVNRELEIELRQGIAKTIKDQHGVGAEWIAEVPREEQSGTAARWSGPVQVYRLVDHPVAPLAYCWFDKKNDETRIVVALHTGSVTTPLEAIRAAEMGEASEGLRSIAP